MSELIRMVTWEDSEVIGVQEMAAVFAASSAHFREIGQLSLSIGRQLQSAFCYAHAQELKERAGKGKGSKISVCPHCGAAPQEGAST